MRWTIIIIKRQTYVSQIAFFYHLSYEEMLEIAERAF